MFTSLVDRVIDTIEKKENVPQSVFIQSRFIEGGSCRRIER